MPAGTVIASCLRFDLPVALSLGLASAVGTRAVLPYLFASFPTLLAKVKVPFVIFAAAQSLQAAILVFVLADPSWLLLVGSGAGEST